MRSVLFVILMLTQLSLSAEVKLTEVDNWQDCQEQFACIDLSGTVVLHADKPTGLYSTDLELLRVIMPQQPDTIRAEQRLSRIAVRRTSVSSITLFHREVLPDKEEKSHLSSLYRDSLLLLLYFALVLTVLLRNKGYLRLLHPLRFDALPSGGVVPWILALCVAFMLTIIVSPDYFWTFLLVILILFGIKMFVGLFLDSPDRADHFIYPLFKVINVLFLLFMAGRMWWVENVNILISAESVLYLLMIYFTMYGIRDAFLRFKKIHFSYIFCYLCALEILPVLLLKEYYVI